MLINIDEYQNRQIPKICLFFCFFIDVDKLHVDKLLFINIINNIK